MNTCMYAYLFIQLCVIVSLSLVSLSLSVSPFSDGREEGEWSS